MKSSKYNSTQKDEILKRMIIERTKALEYKVIELIKEYAQFYQKIYQKPLDLKYAYISILKKVKYFTQERYGERLNIICNFYCRYLEQKQWQELVEGIIAESQRKMQAVFCKENNKVIIKNRYIKINISIFNYIIITMSEVLRWQKLF